MLVILFPEHTGVSVDPQKWRFHRGQKIYLVQEERDEYLVREFVLKKAFNFFGPGCHYLTCDPPIGGSYMINKSFCSFTKTESRHPPATPALMQLVGSTREEAVSLFVALQLELMLQESNKCKDMLKKLLRLKARFFNGNRVSGASLVADV